jgi:3'(2'), 5'-bisphosphate nucleotidase
MQYTHHLITAIDAALKAGKAIMEIYESDFSVETKSDKSPLTLADKRSHEIIDADLSRHTIPIISEEGKSIPYEQRKGWDTAWIVDPLDGTKEFIKRNGEFTVNIALIENQKPILGVVFAPVPQWLYFGSVEIGAYKVTELQPNMVYTDRAKAPEDQLKAVINCGSRLPLAQPEKETYMIVGSRSHGTPELEAFVEQKRIEKGAVEFIAAGSSLKICLVAEGAADIYPRLGLTMEWDTAAGHAVAECAGASVYIHSDGSELIYNRPDQLNPYFIVERKN